MKERTDKKKVFLKAEEGKGMIRSAQNHLEETKRREVANSIPGMGNDSSFMHGLFCMASERRMVST